MTDNFEYSDNKLDALKQIFVTPNSLYHEQIMRQWPPGNM